MPVLPRAGHGTRNVRAVREEAMTITLHNLDCLPERRIYEFFRQVVLVLKKPIGVFVCINCDITTHVGNNNSNGKGSVYYRRKRNH